MLLIAATLLASSVFPVPAGPSTRTGLASPSPPETTLAMRSFGRYPTLLSPCSTSSGEPSRLEPSASTLALTSVCRSLMRCAALSTLLESGHQRPRAKAGRRPQSPEPVSHRVADTSPASAPYGLTRMLAARAPGRPRSGQPWRAFQRGFRLLSTNTFRPRRTTTDPAVCFNALIEFLAFIAHRPFGLSSLLLQVVEGTTIFLRPKFRPDADPRDQSRLGPVPAGGDQLLGIEEPKQRGRCRPKPRDRLVEPGA